MKRIVLMGTALAIGVVTLAGAAVVDHKMAALKMILKQNTATSKAKAVWVVKPFAETLPSVSPLTAGGALTVKGLNETDTAPLPAIGWKTNTGGTLFKFVNKDAPGGTSLCKVAVLKSGSVFKVVCKDSIIDLDDLAQATMRMNLKIGDDNYCSQCLVAAVKKDEPGKFIAKGCLAPVAACYGSASLAFLGSSADLLD